MLQHHIGCAAAAKRTRVTGFRGTSPDTAANMAVVKTYQIFTTPRLHSGAT